MHCNLGWQSHDGSGDHLAGCQPQGGGGGLGKNWVLEIQTSEGVRDWDMETGG